MSKTDSLRLFPLLLAVAPLAAQHPADIKTATKAPDPVKGPHQQGPLTDAELARLRPRPRLHPVGSVAHTITNPATTGSPTASQVLYGRVENGELWALADTYKAGFTPNGFTYVPFLGSSAPCNYPVHFVLRAVRVGSVDLAFAPEARVRRTGDRVILERGAVREIYDLAPQQVEQTFVVDAGLAGDVEIELAVVSDLTEDAERVGLMFCNHLGGVEYGTAFLVDGAVKRPISSTFADGILRLHVPAAVRGVGPVVVDPILSTRASAWGLSREAINPDVAYDVSTDRYLVVQELPFSQSDTDIVFEMRDGNNNPVPNSMGVIDSTPAQQQYPRVANLNAADRFLVVFQDYNGHAAPGQQYSIQGRTVEATMPFSIGPVIQISDPNIVGDKFVADVGGDPNPVGPTYWTVVFSRKFNDNDWDIHGRQVTADGTPRAQTIEIENTSGTIYMSPQISLSNGNGIGAAARWMVVYSFRHNANDWDVFGTALAADGTITAPNSPIDTGFDSDLYPFVSSPAFSTAGQNPFFMVNYERQSTLHMIGTMISAQFVRIIAPTDLSAQFGFGGYWCRSESDGVRFAVTHGQRTPAGDIISVATLGFDDTTSPVHFLLHEGSQPLVRPNGQPIHAAMPMIASKRSGGGAIGDFAVAFIDRDQTPPELNLATYVGRQPGTMFHTRATSCGGLSLNTIGWPLLGESVRFALANFGSDLFGEVLGLPGPTLPLCPDGCKFGLDLQGPILNFPNISLLTLQIPNNPALLGATMAVQGYSLGSGSCLGVFRFTDTIDFTIR